MKKKVLLGIAGFIAAVLVLSMFIPIPINIDKKIKAVEISFDDPNYCKRATINVKGKLCFYLIGDDTFQGSISIEGYELTQQRGVSNYVFSGKPGGRLAYGEMEKEVGFGTFEASTFLDKWVILVYKDDTTEGASRWNTIDGYCIIGPAATREDAKKVFNSVSDIKWPEQSF